VKVTLQSFASQMPHQEHQPYLQDWWFSIIGKPSLVYCVHHCVDIERTILTRWSLATIRFMLRWTCISSIFS